MPQQPDGFSLGHHSYPYLRYSLVVNYSWDSGVIAAPIAYTTGGASNIDTSVGVEVTRGQGRKVVTFDMLRQGAQPEIPDPTPYSENEELLTADVTAHDRKVSADGRHYLYAASGVYTYRLTRPIFPTEAKWPLGAVERGTREDLDTFQAGGFEN